MERTSPVPPGKSVPAGKSMPGWARPRSRGSAETPIEQAGHLRPPATLASLAAEVGVSRTTVSNAYNRPDQLSPQLRARVMEAAARLGYPGPDPVARSLRTRKAGAIGLLMTEEISYAFRDPAAVEFLGGLTLQTNHAKVGLLLVPAGPDLDDVTAVSSASVDGFVVYSMPDDDPHLRAVLRRPVPSVICDQPALPGIDLVGIDDRAAARQIADHLVGLGHRRVGVVCMRLGRARRDGPVAEDRQTSAHYHVQRNRLAGLRDGFSAAGVAWDRVPVVEQFDHSVESGAQGAATVLSLDPGITALIATSDVLALGAMREIERRRQRVPEDVSVTGFDGVHAALERGLTTIEQPVEDKGRYAGRLLLDPARSTRGRRIVLPTVFRPGVTTARPRV